MIRGHLSSAKGSRSACTTAANADTVTNKAAPLSEFEIEIDDTPSLCCNARSELERPLRCPVQGERKRGLTFLLRGVATGNTGNESSNFDFLFGLGGKAWARAGAIAINEFFNWQQSRES